jgi:hypothetical protein
MRGALNLHGKTVLAYYAGKKPGLEGVAMD